MSLAMGVVVAVRPCARGTLAALGCVVAAACGSDPEPSDASSAAGTPSSVDECATAADCGTTAEDCMVRVCTDGRCVEEPAPSGTLAEADTVGDCRTVVCDGSGTRVVLYDDGDVFD